MGDPHLVTVPSASAHAFDHLGFAIDLLVAGALRALRPCDDVTISATRDDTNIPSVRAAADTETRDFAAATTALAGDPVVIGSTRTPEAAAWTQQVWARLQALGVLETGAFVAPWCDVCDAYVDAAARVSVCPACGGEVRDRVERNWFLRTEPFADYLARWRETVTTMGPAAAAARTSPPPPALISVSRSVSRTRGVGVPVPDDPDQVIHSGLVVAACYLMPTAAGGWATAASRTQVLGKGVVNLHTTVVPLLCAALGTPAADRLHVHHHIRVDGADPRTAARDAASLSGLLQTYGAPRIRWWLARLGLTRRDADLALRDLPHLRGRELDTSSRGGHRTDPERFAPLLERDLDAADLGRIARGILVARSDPTVLDALPPASRRRFDAIESWICGTGAAA